MKPERKTTHLSLTRIIPAPPTEVFDGWLSPQCPGTPWSMADKLILDPKVDGLFYFHVVKETGEGKPHYGRFTLLDRPSKAQYTWMSPNTRGQESLVTVAFQKKGKNTLLTLRHENLPDDEVGRSHEKGWLSLVGRFADRFGRDRNRP